jgi:signal peptidase I
MPDLLVRADGRARYQVRRPGGLPAVLSWVGVGLRVVAAVVLVVLVGLVATALVPQGAGLDAHAVISGSMAPQVQAGDVVLTAPVDDSELRPGQVLLFTDPQQPDRLLLHRLVSFDSEGYLVTRGDANQSDDSAHVAPSDVRGLARLRIPFIGLPAVWRAEGQFGRIALAAVLLAGASASLVGGPGRRHAPGGHAGRPPAPGVGRHRSSSRTNPPMTSGRPAAAAHA